MPPVFPVTLFDQTALTDGVAVTSRAIDINTYEASGYFSVQASVTGAGSVRLIYEVSNNGVDFVSPSNASDILNAFTAASGSAGNGKDLVSFTPPPARYFRFQSIPTGSATFSATLVIQ